MSERDALIALNLLPLTPAELRRLFDLCGRAAVALEALGSGDVRVEDLWVRPRETGPLPPSTPSPAQASVLSHTAEPLLDGHGDHGAPGGTPIPRSRSRRRRYGSTGAFEDASYASDVVPLDHGAPRRLGAAGLERLARGEIERARSASVRIVTTEDEAYPALLREIHDPPPVLYVRGTLEPDDEVRVAVVGSRLATEDGLDAAFLLARDLARCGVTIVSGLARGIDRRAHEGALEAQARTIAVLGSGLGRLYPREHGRLARGVAARGAVVTEYPFDMPPLSICFPRRNRVISGLSAGVVVVEAAMASGALGTARLALDQGREVFAVPGPATHATSVGTNGLLRAGAAHLACLSLDVLDELPVVFRVRLGLPALVCDEPDAPRRAAFALPLGSAAAGGPASESGGGAKTTLDPETAAVLRHLRGGESLSMDELVSRCGLPVQRALAAVSILEMRGLAEALPGDRVCRAVGPR